MTLVEAIKSDLAKCRINIEPIILENWQEHTDSVFSENAQMFFDGAGSIFIGEPEYFLDTFYHSESRYNYFRYNNTLVDSLLELAKVEADSAKRHDAYQLIIEQIVEDIPAIFFSHVIPHFAYNSEKIKTMSATPYRMIRFNKIELFD
jgi:ABC-type transport system substrate-binding protein